MTPLTSRRGIGTRKASQYQGTPLMVVVRDSSALAPVPMSYDTTGGRASRPIREPQIEPRKPAEPHPSKLKSIAEEAEGAATEQGCLGVPAGESERKRCLPALECIGS